MKKTILSLALATLIYAPSAFSHAGDWGYAEHNGPHHWQGLCQSGKNQSPVNIHHALHTRNITPVHLDYHHAQGQVVNNGHTIQFNLASNQFIEIGGVRYKLIQLHFHSPSEHKIDGKLFPMEMHLVHQNADGQLAVVAVMFEEGKQNSALDRLWQAVPKNQSEDGPLPNGLDLAQLLPKEKDFYTLNGSLTTPPCSEGVRWVIMQTPMSLSDEQLKQFNQFYHGNNRPVQPINARYILK